MWNEDIYMQVNITEAVVAIEAYQSEDDFFDDLVEYDTLSNELDFRNIVRFALKNEIDILRVFVLWRARARL